VVTVTGTGWPAGGAVTVTYVGPISQSKQTVTVGAHGGFVAQVRANGLVPGSYTVRASGGGHTATASFDQTT
jgi:hypothetical protein